MGGNNKFSSKILEPLGLSLGGIKTELSASFDGHFLSSVI